jgi:hypothetical protein
MAALLNQEIRALLVDPSTVKVLATLDEAGIPHAVVRQSLQLGDDGNLFYNEFLESSRTNKNLVRSIWYDRQVSIAIHGSQGQNYQIRGIPVKTHITGPLYQKQYSELRQKNGDVDLAAVWIIEPLEVIDENFAVLNAEQEKNRPFLKHLDRLARQEAN